MALTGRSLIELRYRDGNIGSEPLQVPDTNKICRCIYYNIHIFLKKYAFLSP